MDFPGAQLTFCLFTCLLEHRHVSHLHGDREHMPLLGAECLGLKMTDRFEALPGSVGSLNIRQAAASPPKS